MQLETPSKSAPEAGEPGLAAKKGLSSSVRWTVALFVVFWITFYLLDRGLPYLKNGSDVVTGAKMRLEETGQVYPAGSGALRVMIFGNSKILAGFLPSLFDRMAAAAKLDVSSFNSGFPGSDVFLPQLTALCERGQAPNVLFLTLPWEPDPPKRDIFHLVPDDHAVVQALFPFRFWLRDATSFLMGARSHGGVVNFYKEAQSDARSVLADRGYYLITEQSRFPGGRLPNDFHLASDTPNEVEPRLAPAKSGQAGQLNRLVRQYHMHCYFVPYYLRIGEKAPPAAHDQGFAAAVESATSCKVLGPDYFLYPNPLFSDQTHLNTAGARVYTAALFDLVEKQLSQGHESAVQ